MFKLFKYFPLELAKYRLDGEEVAPAVAASEGVGVMAKGLVDAYPSVAAGWCMFCVRASI